MQAQTGQTIRHATAGDIPALLAIFEAAKEKMHAACNPQWPAGYPNEEVLRADIAQNGSWLLEQDGRPIATMALLAGIEPTYVTIYNGTWPGGEAPYATVHRVAVDPAAQGGGLAYTLYMAGEAWCRENGLASVRVDTHRQNAPMQSFLARLGFVQCGIIYLANGDERLAFEKLL